MKNYSIGLYEKALPDSLTWKEKLEITKECGFDYLEISIDESEMRLSRLKSAKEERKSLVNTTYETGVPILSMCLSAHRKYPLGSLNEDDSKKSLEIMNDALKLASDLGVRYIQLAGYDVYYDRGNKKTEAHFLENLKKASSLASCYGVMMGFETMETNFMNTVSKAMKYVKMIDSPYLNVYPDIGNLTNAFDGNQEKMFADILSGKGRLIAAHIKETIKDKFREIPFNKGRVNFKEDLVLLQSIGVRRFVVECWYKGQDNWKKDLMDVNRQMREYLDGESNESK